jgi:DDE superfamily endonuclease
MNPYPDKNSVIILDNARIHHDDEWIEIVENLGGRVLFLPPYSPDYNPIETAFSFMKSWLKRNRGFVKACNDPQYLFTLVCAHITSDMAHSFYRQSIYG